jgi:D-aspartate ligase
VNHQITTSQPPILLFDAGFYGTLAAARSLGRAGVPVVVADRRPVTPTRFSRYVTRNHVCPPVAKMEKFVEWLLAYGAREGRHAIYPTSDEVAYVLSAHHEELSKHFLLYQPPLETLLRVLDKKALLAAGSATGFDIPETWFPESRADVERAAHESDGPLMIKPRTQIFLKTHKKGAMASCGPGPLCEEYARFVQENTYEPSIVNRMPELGHPMLQRYYPEAAESIHSVTGFRDSERANLVLFGAVKVLQRPRRMGVGLCFEREDVEPEVATRVCHLLDKLGYYGVFEIEFVRVGKRLLLIDMNPRFYNQIALDIARGLPLPRIAYAAALGDQGEVTRLVSEVPSGEAAYVFCNSLGLRLLVAAQRLTGAMSAGDAEGWRRWVKKGGERLVDAVADKGDPAPYWAETAAQAYGCVRHPRAFLRMIAFDR